MGGGGAVSGAHPSVVVAPGPRAAQAELFARLEAFLKPLPRQPELLARPVRVVVPSSPLRRHLQAELVRRRGGAAVGVAVQTLYALAREVLERAGKRPGTVGDSLLPIMVERFARREGALAFLAGYEEGYGTLHAAVRDLLDAGLEAAHVEAMEERLAQVGGEEGERAAAVVRVAAKAALALAAEGVERPAGVLSLAAERLRADADVLPARAVLVYGFADATGLAADLLAALVRNGATVVMDLPPHPADPARPDSGAAFSARLRQRLGSGDERKAADSLLPPGELEAFVAADAEEEAQEVARRVRRLLDEGARAEGIGVVARELLPYRDALARHLDRFAVPWSAEGTPGPWVPWARRVRSALALLRHGGDAPVEAFLAAAEGVSPLLEVALPGIGVGRLGHLATLVPAGALPVPLAAGSEGDEEWVRRRVVGREELELARGRARETEHLLVNWGEPASLAEHRQALDGLVRSLGWRAGGEAAASWEGLLSEIEAGVPPSTLLQRRELYLLLERAAEVALRAGEGGGGGGVMVAPVMAARGWTFEHLFVMGCNRGVFPRRGAQDPLLPDRVRGALVPLLPDLPLKGDPAAEERYLFAQVCAASPRVTVSWRRLGERGAILPPSPLLAPLALPVVEAGSAEPPGRTPISALEAARQVGVTGDRSALATLWAAVGPGAGGGMAQSRIAVLEEQDPLWEAEPGSDPGHLLGPYVGLVGGAPLAGRRLSVTLLEAVARCPWQVFVTRVLRVEPPVDPDVRVGELDARLIGTAVHRALARLLAPGGEGEAVEDVGPPEDGEIAAAARAAAAEVGGEEGLAQEAAALAAPRVEALVRAARRLLWPEDAPLAVAGVEAEGEVGLEVGGEEWKVVFRADLVEKTDDGARLTDFKTGRNPFSQKKAASVTEAYLKGVRRGERLQAAAYAAGWGGVGRFLFVSPEQDPARAREVAVTGDQARPALAEALGVLAPLWSAGAMFPRLESAADGQEPRACQWCPVREACWRGDSGVRRRLTQWARRVGPDPPPEVGAAAVALARGWFLPAAPDVGGEE